MDYKYLFTSFEGRINRQPFWIGSLILFGISIVLQVLAAVLFGADSTVGSLISLVVALVLLVPSIAIGVKRFHDRGKSGWWLLIILIPFIGGIWYLVECGFLAGTAGPNEYGPDPLGQNPVAGYPGQYGQYPQQYDPNQQYGQYPQQGQQPYPQQGQYPQGQYPQGQYPQQGQYPDPNQQQGGWPPRQS